MLKKIRIFSLSLLFFASPTLANVNFEFDVLDKSPKIGETLKIDIHCNRRIINPSATFAGRSWTVTYLKKKGFMYHYVLYAGISRYLQPKTYKCVITLPLKHSSFTKTVTFDIKESQFPYGTVSLPKTKTDLANNKNQLSIESKLISKKFNSKTQPGTNYKFKTTFMLPAKGNFSSTFGKYRKYKGTKKLSSKHSGLDIANITGTKIVASNDGTVILSEPLKIHGMSIMIDHGFGIKTIYNHMSKLLVKTGDIVKRGQLIGKMGTTGISTGPHLHWGIGVQNVRVDPLHWVSTHGLYNELTN